MSLLTQNSNKNTDLDKQVPHNHNLHHHNNAIVTFSTRFIQQKQNIIFPGIFFIKLAFPKIDESFGSVYIMDELPATSYLGAQAFVPFTGILLQGSQVLYIYCDHAYSTITRILLLKVSFPTACAREISHNINCLASWMKVSPLFNVDPLRTLCSTLLISQELYILR